MVSTLRIVIFTIPRISHLITHVSLLTLYLILEYHKQNLRLHQSKLLYHFYCLSDGRYIYSPNGYKSFAHDISPFYGGHSPPLHDGTRCAPLRLLYQTLFSKTSYIFVTVMLQYCYKYRIKSLLLFANLFNSSVYPLAENKINVSFLLSLFQSTNWAFSFNS